MQDHCLQRLRPLVPRMAQVKKVRFSALGNFATYYVVSYHFTAQLANARDTRAALTDVMASG